MVGRLAARLLEVVAGRPVELVHVEVAIDQDARRREALQQRALERVAGAARGSRGERRPVASVRLAARRADQREIHDVVARRPEPAVDPPFLRYWLEQVLLPGDALGGAEKQVPALAQREVEQGEHLLLDLRLEVDQQVAAADQIEPGERRVLQQVLGREGDRFPQRPS